MNIFVAAAGPKLKWQEGKIEKLETKHKDTKRAQVVSRGNTELQIQKVFYCKKTLELRSCRFT